LNFQQLNCYHALFLYLCHVESLPYINPLNPLRNVRITTANIDPLHSRPHTAKIKSVITAVWITTMMLWIRMWDSRISSVLTPIAYLHYSYYYGKKKRKWRSYKTVILCGDKITLNYTSNPDTFQSICNYQDSRDCCS